MHGPTAVMNDDTIICEADVYRYTYHIRCLYRECWVLIRDGKILPGHYREKGEAIARAKKMRTEELARIEEEGAKARAILCPGEPA